MNIDWPGLIPYAILAIGIFFICLRNKIKYGTWEPY